jgi:lysophospholipase L1-like esterase
VEERPLIHRPPASGAATPSKQRKLVVPALFAALLLLATAALLETLLVVLRSSPRLAALPLLSDLACNLYRSDWNVIQLDPACARYDPELTYTLRPGICTFSNTEYTTTVRINRLGLRDDEASLHGPEIVVLGDSVAMGWGVGQDETFPQVLEHLSGRKVLNAAVASYGTARELLMLRRVDRSRLRYLVWQYSSNDLEENEAFLEHDFTLPVQSGPDYARYVAKFQRERHYHPGEYLLFSMRGAVDGLRRAVGLRRAPTTDFDAERHAAAFVEVLEHADAEIDSLPVIVFLASLEDTGRFASAVREAIDQSPRRNALRNLHPFDLSGRIQRSDFFSLDRTHLAASGDAKIGRELLREIAVIEADRAH